MFLSCIASASALLSWKYLMYLFYLCSIFLISIKSKNGDNHYDCPHFRFYIYTDKEDIFYPDISFIFLCMLSMSIFVHLLSHSFFTCLHLFIVLSLQSIFSAFFFTLVQGFHLSCISFLFLSLFPWDDLFH